MPGTTFGIIMIVIAAVVGLVVLEVLVLAAAERPYFKHPHPDRMWGNVRGGVHLGDPRSGAPHDEPVGTSGPPAAKERQGRDHSQPAAGTAQQVAARPGGPGHGDRRGAAG